MNRHLIPALISSLMLVTMCCAFFMVLWAAWEVVGWVPIVLGVTVGGALALASAFYGWKDS